MKKFIALLLSLAMVLSLCSLTACGKRGGEGDTNKDGQTADAKYTLTIGHVYTEDSIEHKQMAKIKELVEENTNGACQVKIFANEQLGDEQNIAEQCVTGACDMGFSEGSVWATVTNKPEFAVFGLPFQYSNIDAAIVSVFVYKSMSFKDLINVLRSASVNMAMVMMIIGFSSIFSYARRYGRHILLHARLS